MNKWMYIAGVVLIAGFAAMMVIDLQKAGTPRVTTVAEARGITDKPIRFTGAIVPDKTTYDRDTQELHFELRGEKGDTLTVHYRGARPADFDAAERAMVTGTYRGGKLVATRILIERPLESKGR